MQRGGCRCKGVGVGAKGCVGVGAKGCAWV